MLLIVAYCEHAATFIAGIRSASQNLLLQIAIGLRSSPFKLTAIGVGAYAFSWTSFNGRFLPKASQCQMWRFLTMWMPLSSVD